MNRPDRDGHGLDLPGQRCRSRGTGPGLGERQEGSHGSRNRFSPLQPWLRSSRNRSRPDDDRPSPKPGSLSVRTNWRRKSKRLSVFFAVRAFHRAVFHKWLALKAARGRNNNWELSALGVATDAYHKLSESSQGRIKFSTVSYLCFPRRVLRDFKNPIFSFIWVSYT